MHPPIPIKPENQWNDIIYRKGIVVPMPRCLGDGVRSDMLDTSLSIGAVRGGREIGNMFGGIAASGVVRLPQPTGFSRVVVHLCPEHVSASLHCPTYWTAGVVCAGRAPRNPCT
jgi:hypothetical protein